MGGFMTAAPVDVAATFDGAMWESTTIEPAFNWRGRRARASFTFPKRHHNMRQLMLVVEGSVTVLTDEDSKDVGAGAFWVAEVDKPYTMSVGSEGVRYLECWTGPMSLIETVWYDDETWVRR
jgi:mannose-6-phosphate isomerase-like protein (cupin superfamily)